MSRSPKYTVNVHNQKDQREASINSLASRSTMSRPVSALSTDTDSSSDSMWSTQANQNADPKTKVNSKGQVVTVYNHHQGNPTNEPTPSYNSAQAYGRH